MFQDTFLACQKNMGSIALCFTELLFPKLEGLRTAISRNKISMAPSRDNCEKVSLFPYLHETANAANPAETGCLDLFLQSFGHE